MGASLHSGSWWSEEGSRVGDGVELRALEGAGRLPLVLTFLICAFLTGAPGWFGKILSAKPVTQYLVLNNCLNNLIGH